MTNIGLKKVLRGQLALSELTVNYGRLVGRMDEQAIVVASLLKGAKIWDIKLKKKLLLNS